MPRTYVTPSGHTVSFMHPLGAGQFGEAKAVKDRKGNMYCLKEVMVKVTDDKARNEALNEVTVMKETCKHPNVIMFFESWFERNRMCILMEYAPNGSLDKLILQYTTAEKRFTLSKVRSFIEELAGALDHCHRHGIIHRDIKPGNILIDQLGSLKLADFGLSRALEPNHLATTFCGSPLYMAPEQCTAGERYSFPADIWAMGCVVFEIMAFHSPWVSSTGAEPKNFPALVQRVLYGSPNYESLSRLGYPQRMVDLVRWMLQRNVAKRASASDIVDLLELRAPPTLAQTIIKDIRPSPNMPTMSAPPLETTIDVSDTLILNPPSPPKPEDETMKRRKQLIDDAKALVGAARLVQRSFRTSVQRRRMMDIQKPVDPSPLRPMDRYTPTDANERTAVELANVVRLQGAMRISLNRRRRDSDFPRPPSRRPVGTAPKTTLNDSGGNAPCSARIQKLAEPRAGRIPQSTHITPPIPAKNHTRPVTRPLVLPSVRQNTARPTPRYVWH